MAVVQLPRPQGIDFAKLGQLAGQAANPQAGLQEQLLPLLFKARLEEKLQDKKMQKQQEFQAKNFALFKTLAGDKDITYTVGPKGLTVKTHQPKAPLRPSQELSDVKAGPELEQRKTPIKKSPLFTEGSGLPAFLSPNKAKITPATRSVISNIKSEFDFKEFLEDIEDYAAAGVDTKAILEYFGKQQEG